ncbi:MAG: gamma-glutamyltransferase [Cyanophyceae cyanobacterium]
MSKILIKTRQFWVRAIAVASVLTVGQPWGQAVSAQGLFQFDPDSGIRPGERPATGAIASAHPLATDAGYFMLGEGGNAVDAAVATALAISVVTPFSAGIGGGGFALHFEPETGEIEALDFRERAPGSAYRELYLDEDGKPKSRRISLDGHLAAGVPGTVAGLAELHRKYGKLPWSRVVAPSIELAEQGFTITQRLADRSKGRLAVLSNNPAARAIFTQDGEPLAVGDTLVQRDLANVLQTIAVDPQQFYTGWIAELIEADMVVYGGLVTREDLANYSVKWRSPLCGEFQAYRVCSMPPPSSGGVHLVQMLNMLNLFPEVLESVQRNPSTKALGDYTHLLAEVMKIAYADRAEYLGDPDFVDVPVKALISDGYGIARAGEIDLDSARPASEVNPASAEAIHQYTQRPDFPETSHLSVIDSDGRAVSLTFTVNGPFGAGVVATGTGILLNNEMDDFAIAPGVPNLFGVVGGDANAIAPGKTPLSSMSPTIVTSAENPQQLEMVLGTPGGSRIITMVLQVFLNATVRGMSLDDAVGAPRLHHQWQPDMVFYDDPAQSRYEPVRQRVPAIAPEILASLQQRGHELRGFFPVGNANILRRLSNGSVEGAIDPRGEGTVQLFREPLPLPSYSEPEDLPLPAAPPKPE